MPRPGRLARAALVVGLVVALDQLSKQWALSRLGDGRTIEIIPTLEFDLAYNSGFSFSAGSGNGNIVGLVVIGMCLAIAFQIWREADPVRALLLAAILGGALGNLLDRLFRADDGFLSGEVVDFIDVSWYAVFNVADMFVVCGCVAFVVHELQTHRSGRVRPDGHPDPDAQAHSPSDVSPRKALQRSVDSTVLSTNPSRLSLGAPKTWRRTPRRLSSPSPITS
jgi:signal peptidase II